MDFVAFLKCIGSKTGISPHPTPTQIKIIMIEAKCFIIFVSYHFPVDMKSLIQKMRHIMFSFAKCTDVCLTICVVRAAVLLKLETAGVI